MITPSRWDSQKSYERYSANLRQRSRKVLKDMKDAGLMYRRMFSVVHPMIHYPGWLLRGLPAPDRSIMRHPPQPVSISEFACIHRFISIHGMEMRLTPKADGLFLQWFYHTPMSGPVLVRDWLKDSTRYPRRLPVYDQTIPWAGLAPHAGASAHDKIDFAGRILPSNIPEKPKTIIHRLDDAGTTQIDFQSCSLWVLTSTPIAGLNPILSDAKGGVFQFNRDESRPDIVRVVQHDIQRCAMVLDTQVKEKGRTYTAWLTALNLVETVKSSCSKSYQLIKRKK